MNPGLELCCLKVYQSTGVKVHLVIACGFGKDNVKSLTMRVRVCGCVGPDSDQIRFGAENKLL